MSAIYWKNAQDLFVTNDKFLQHLKKKCNESMNAIDNIKSSTWNFYRKMLNPHDFPPTNYAANRAFYKLWEIIANNSWCIPDSLTNLNTLHLAEAPGSFVQVIKTRFPDAKCTAVTKPIECGDDVIPYNQEVLKLPNVDFLQVDLLNPSDTKQFINGTQTKFHFITADGGLDDEGNFSQKETLHLNLIQSQIICILNLQEIGGSCVLKFFETFTETTVNILYLLSSHYEELHLCKPKTSRPTNAEKYILCMKFKGLTFEKNDLLGLLYTPLTEKMELNFPVSEFFISAMNSFARSQTSRQITDINNIVNRIKSRIPINKDKCEDQKKTAFMMWASEYDLDKFVDI